MGDFEQVPLNGGFDWRTREVPYLWFAFPNSGAYRGGRCLRLDFTVGRNDESEAVYQFVPAAPKQEYLLTAYARSNNITSDSGPRLRLLDPACPTCLDISSETTVGTTPWHPVSLKFSTGDHAQVVRVSVWRPRSRTFPTEITGTFWLDAVSLKRLKPRSRSRNSNDEVTDAASGERRSQPFTLYTLHLIRMKAQTRLEARTATDLLHFTSDALEPEPHALHIARLLLVAVLLAAPLPFGAVQAWAWTALAGSGVCLAVFVGRRVRPAGLAENCPVAALLAPSAIPSAGDGSVFRSSHA